MPDNNPFILSEIKPSQLKEIKQLRENLDQFVAASNVEASTVWSFSTIGIETNITKLNNAAKVADNAGLAFDKVGKAYARMVSVLQKEVVPAVGGELERVGVRTDTKTGKIIRTPQMDQITKSAAEKYGISNPRGLENLGLMHQRLDVLQKLFRNLQRVTPDTPDVIDEVAKQIRRWNRTGPKGTSVIPNRPLSQEFLSELDRFVADQITTLVPQFADKLSKTAIHNLGGKKGAALGPSSLGAANSLFPKLAQAYQTAGVGTTVSRGFVRQAVGATSSKNITDLLELSQQYGYTDAYVNKRFPRKVVNLNPPQARRAQLATAVGASDASHITESQASRAVDELNKLMGLTGPDQIKDALVAAEIEKRQRRSALAQTDKDKLSIKYPREPFVPPTLGPSKTIKSLNREQDPETFAFKARMALRSIYSEKELYPTQTGPSKLFKQMWPNRPKLGGEGGFFNYSGGDKSSLDFATSNPNFVKALTIPTVQAMKEAKELMGDDTFRQLIKRAQEGRSYRTPTQQAASIESYAREIVAGGGPQLLAKYGLKATGTLAPKGMFSGFIDSLKKVFKDERGFSSLIGGTPPGKKPVKPLPEVSEDTMKLAQNLIGKYQYVTLKKLQDGLKIDPALSRSVMAKLEERKLVSRPLGVIGREVLGAQTPPKPVVKTPQAVTTDLLSSAQKLLADTKFITQKKLQEALDIGPKTSKALVAELQKSQVIGPSRGIKGHEVLPQAQIVTKPVEPPKIARQAAIEKEVAALKAIKATPKKTLPEVTDSVVNAAAQLLPKFQYITVKSLSQALKSDAGTAAAALGKLQGQGLVSPPLGIRGRAVLDPRLSGVRGADKFDVATLRQIVDVVQAQGGISLSGIGKETGFGRIKQQELMQVLQRGQVVEKGPGTVVGTLKPSQLVQAMDPAFQKVAEGVIRTQNASIKNIMAISGGNQERASDIAKQLQYAGVVSTPIPTKGRQPLIASEQLERLGSVAAAVSERLSELARVEQKITAARAAGGGGAPPKIPVALGGGPGGKEEFPGMPKGFDPGGVKAYTRPLQVPTETQSFLADQANARRGPSVRPLSAAFRTLGQYAGAAAVVYPIFQSIQDALSAGVQLETLMARIQGILPAKFMSDRLEIRKSIVSVAREYGVDILDAARAAQVFAQTGEGAVATTEDLADAMRAVQAIGLNPDQAEELLIAVKNITYEYDKQKSTVSGPEILDRIARVEARRAVSAQDLANALKQVGPLARQLRGDFVGLADELDVVAAATTQIVQSTRVSGAQAATSLRFMLARIGRPEVLKQLEKFGNIKLGTLASQGKQLRPLIEIIYELSTAYNGLIKQGKGAEANRLLVSIAGARQLNAAAALLKDFNRLVETAILSSEGFGDTQERLAIQLNTTQVKLLQLKTALRGIGASLVETSAFGQVFKVVLDLITSGLNFIGNSGSASASRLLLVAGALAATYGVAKQLGKGLLYLVGGLTRMQLMKSTLAPVSGAFLALGDKITGVAGGFTRFILGISKMIGPTVLLTLAVGAVVAATGAMISLFKKAHALNVSFLSPEGIDVNRYSKITDFREFAAKSEQTPVEFFNAVSKAMAQVNEEFGLTGQIGVKNRQIVLDSFLQKLLVVAPKLADYFNEIAGGSEGAARLAKINTELARIGSTASFISNAVFGANQERLITAGEDIIARLQTRVDRFTQMQQNLKRPLPKVAAVSFGGSLSPVSTVDAVQSLSEVIGTIDEDFGPIISDLLRAGDATGVFKEQLDSINAKQKAGEIISIGDAFGILADRLEQISTAKTVKGGNIPSYNQLLDKYTELIRGRLLAKNKVPAFDIDLSEPQQGLKRFYTFNVKIFRDVLQRLAREANPALRKQARDVLNFNKGLFMELEGTGLSIGGLTGRLAGLKNPLDDIIADFYVGTRRLDEMSAASERLGLTFDYTAEKWKLFRETATRLFTVPSEALKELLNVQQQLNSAAKQLNPAGLQGVGATLADSLQTAIINFDPNAEPTKNIAPGTSGVADEAQQAAAQVARLNLQLTALTGIYSTLSTMDVPNVFASFREQAGGTELSPVVDEMQIYIQRLRGEKSALDELLATAYPNITGANETDILRRRLEEINKLPADSPIKQKYAGLVHDISMSYKELTEIISHGSDLLEKIVLDSERRLGAAEVRKATRIAKIQASTQLGQTTRQARLDVFAQVRGPVAQDRARLANIELTRRAQRQLANETYDAEVAALNIRIAEHKREGADARQDLINLQTTRNTALALADITAESEKHAVSEERLTRLLDIQFKHTLQIQEINAEINKNLRTTLASNRAEAAKSIGEALFSLDTKGLDALDAYPRRLQQISEERRNQLYLAKETLNAELASIEATREAHFDDYAQRKAAAIQEYAGSTLRIEAETELQKIQARTTALQEEANKIIDTRLSNYQERISGIREVLLDVNLLTKGKALSTILSPIASSVAKRQVDTLIEELIDPTKGIFKGIGKALGGFGEFDAMTESIVRGAIRGGQIFEESIIRGVQKATSPTTPNEKINPGSINFQGSPGGIEEQISSVVSSLFKRSTRSSGFPTLPSAETIGLLSGVSSLFSFGATPGRGGKDQITQDLKSIAIASVDTAKSGEDGKKQTEEMISIQAQNKKALTRSLSITGGTLLGSAVGKKPGTSGQGANIGATLGSAGGFALGSQIGTAAGPIGAIAGGLIGGLLGGLFDKPEPPPPPGALEIIARNTGEQVTLLENTNKLLELQALSFNVPSAFTLPAYNPTNFGAGGGAAPVTSAGGAVSVSNEVNVEVNIPSAVTNSREIAQMVGKAVAQELSNQYRGSGRYVSRTVL